MGRGGRGIGGRMGSGSKFVVEVVSMSVNIRHGVQHNRLVNLQGAHDAGA